MDCTEAYKEHIEYTFNAFTKLLYTIQLLTHSGNGADGGKGKSFFGYYTQQEIGGPAESWKQ